MEPMEDDVGEDSGDETLRSMTQQARDKSRRVVRSYGEISKKLDENKDEWIRNPKMLRPAMNEADKGLSNVERPKEMVADAGCFVKIVDKVRLQVEHISRLDETRINVSEFAHKLGSWMNCDVGDGDVIATSAARWADFGRAVGRFYSRVPAMSFLHGAVEKGEVEAKKKKTQSTPNLGIKVAAASSKPEPATSINKRVTETREDEAVEALVNEMYECLITECLERRRKRIGFWELVVDPDSFPQTVENIFHTTFLIKERRAFLVVGEEPDSFQIEPITASMDSSTQNIESDQFVMQFSFRQWKEVKEKFNIEKALLPKQE